MTSEEDGAKSSSDNQDGPMGDQITEREYQTYLINEAKKRNVIICLPTGAGKTLIAVQLTKFYLPEAIRNNQKIIFTANTVPLVKQQAEYFRSNLCNGFLSSECNFVDYLTGDRGIDFKTSSNGSEFFSRDSVHVLFSTPQILVDAINHNYLKFERIRFLVIDECHNSDKDHPMNLLMQKYADKYIKGDKSQLPRVVGLTATIINGKKKSEDIQAEVEDAENRMCAKALTYYDQIVVNQFSTTAHNNVTYVEYLNGKNWPEFDRNIEDLKDLQVQISALHKDVFKTAEELQQEQQVNHSTYRHESQLLTSGSSLTKEIKAILRDVVDVYEDLGPYGSWLAAMHKRASLEPYRRKFVGNELLSSIIGVILTSLEKFISSMERGLCFYDKSIALQDKITEKLSKLLSILKNYGSADSEEETLCGIIFVEARITAQVLSWFLEDLAESVPVYKHLRPAFAVGINAFRLDPIEVRSTVKEQARILSEFHSKNYNIIVATKVIEEGLNVPRCNLVVRWDKINTFPSYIQSMGRARAKGSSFVAFINGEESEKEKRQYQSFHTLNSTLVNYLVTNNSAYQDFYTSEDEIPPYEPVPGCEPRITAQAAISIANGYCQMLPCDKLSCLVPVSWWVDVTENQPTVSSGKAYKVYILFPRNSVIREVVEGDIYANKSLAKRSAFLKACIMLHERGALNENLLPIRRSATADIKKFIESSVKVDDKAAYVEGKHRWHPKRVPAIMAESKVTAKRKCVCYRIVIKLNDNYVCEPELRGLYLFGEREFSYGIVTTMDLSFVPEMQLNVNTAVGSLQVRLEQTHLSDRVRGLFFASEEIMKLQKFERYLFGDLLKLKQWYMDQAKVDSSPMIIVPLMNTMDDSSIHWDLIESVMDGTGDIKPRIFPFQYHEGMYVDSVVIPHYLEEHRLYAVINTMKDSSPLSPMECNKNQSYKEYYNDKYPGVAVITDENQRLLRCKQISENLNFFTPGSQFKKSKEERRSQRGNAVELIPELVQMHKMPASLFIMAKMLPSILQRIYRYACVLELHSQVFPGSLPKCISENEAHEKNGCNVICLTSDDNKYDNISGMQNDVGSKRSSKSFQTTESIDPIRNSVEHYGRLPLDFIHPRRIRMDLFSPEPQISLLKALTWQKSNSTAGSNGAEKVLNSLKFSGHLLPETDIVLENRKDGEMKLDYRHRGEDVIPTSFNLMEAITKHGSNDVVNLERFEIIGDAFLKYQVSRHMYCYFPKFDEGLLTQWRSFFISNKCLYPSGIQLNLNEYLAGGMFCPKSCWIPPSFSIPETLNAMVVKYDMTESVLSELTEEEQRAISKNHDGLHEYLKTVKKKPKSSTPANLSYSYAKMSNKSVADCVEAVIGVYFSESGFNAALQAMKTLGIEAPTPDENGEPSLRKKLDDLVPTPQVDYESTGKEVDDLLPLYKQLEGLLQYKFQNPWLLVEAFTHAGTCKNQVTGSYQRLEYLGDAVLDFLISCHIFRANPNLNPGEITDLRSALVNNVTFASLAVRYGLHTYLLHESKSLQSSIDVFIEHQKRAKHHVTGHFRLISDNDIRDVSAQDIEVPKVLGDLFESLAGAVYVDSGMSLDETWSVFSRLMKHEIETFSKNPPKSPVRQLYEKFPSRKLFEDMEDFADSSSSDYEQPKLQYQRLVIPMRHPRTKEIFNIIGCGNNKESAKLGAAKYFWHLEQTKSPQKVAHDNN